jgi:integrase/recombinase XerD
MKPIAEAVRDYLALRCSLGFKLKRHRRLLEEFAKFLEQKRTSRITSLLALEWAVQPQHLQPVEWAARLKHPTGVCALLECNRPDERGAAIRPAFTSS